MGLQHNAENIKGMEGGIIHKYPDIVFLKNIQMMLNDTLF